MTEAQYKERNLQGFEGDTFMRDQIAEIIKRRKINLVVETGTYLGGTTNQLRQMVKEVITIEVNKDYFQQATENIQDHKNVLMQLGDSPAILTELFEQGLLDKKKTLYLLDAHWGDVCPLKNELAVIADYNERPECIVIHDFKVPDTDFGYDSYKGQPFTWEWVKPEIEAIYGVDGYKFYYNKQAAGAKRGILYVEPK